MNQSLNSSQSLILLVNDSSVEMGQLLKGKIVDSLFWIYERDASLVRPICRGDSEDDVLHQDRLAASCRPCDQGMGCMAVAGTEQQRLAVVLPDPQEELGVASG